MSRSFKCKLCGKSLSVDGSNDASPLLEHIINSHPEIKIPDSVANETVEDVEEAKRKNQLHIPKTKLDQFKKGNSGDTDKSKGQSIQNISQTSEDNKKMSSSDKISESKSQKTADSAKKLPSKTDKTNSDKVTKDINEDTIKKNKSSTQNPSTVDSKSRTSQDKISIKESRASASKASKDMKKDSKIQTNDFRSSISKLRGDSKSSLNKGSNEKGHMSKSPSIQNPKKEANPQKPKNSVDKMHSIKPENLKIPADNDVSEDVYHTPRSSFELPSSSNPKDPKTAVNRSPKNKNEKPFTFKSKTKTSQEMLSDSKNSASKKQPVKSGNHKNSGDTLSSIKAEDNHRKPSGSIELSTKKQHADSMASGDETSSVRSKDKVPKSTKKTNTPLGMQAYDTKYRYTIERWTPGNGQIVCPKCGMKQRPIIRTRSDKYEEKILLNETQQGTLKQNDYENKKDEGYKILEGGDWDQPGKNSTSNNARQEINEPEINLKDFNNRQPEITCLSSNIKIQNQSKPCTIEQSELDQLLPRESAQKFIGWQYKQTQESIDQSQKFDGLHFKNRSQHELNIPLKVSVMNNGRNPRVVYKRRYKIKGIPLQCPARSTSTVTLYKNSLKRWKPGRGTIFCPKCGANKHPTVKTHTDNISNSPLGAACILTCWPLCFLPCLFPPSATEYLYCSVCNNLLGTYDRKTDVIQPVTEKTEKISSMQSTKANNSTREVSDRQTPASASDVKQNKTTK